MSIFGPESEFLNLSAFTARVSVVSVRDFFLSELSPPRSYHKKHRGDLICSCQ
jgi:hypothetical protein